MEMSEANKKLPLVRDNSCPQALQSLSPVTPVHPPLSLCFFSVFPPHSVILVFNLKVFIFREVVLMSVCCNQAGVPASPL